MQAPSNKLRHKHIGLIVATYVVIIALLSITTKIGLDNINALNERLRTVVEKNNIKAKHIDSMINAINKRMNLLHTSIHINDPFEIDEISIKYSLLAGQFIQARDNLIAMGLTSHQLQQLESQRKILKQAQPFLDTVINAVLEENKTRARDNILIAQKINTAVISDLQNMKRLQQSIAESAVSESAIAIEKARSSILMLILTTIFLAAIILVIVVLIITRQDKKVASLLLQLELANTSLEETIILRTDELLKSREENVRMGTELAVTHQLQQMILPATAELNNIPGLAIVASMSPAEEAGGDYYDVLKYHQHYFLSIGDVTGHGLESSVVMMMIQTAVRTMAVAGEIDLPKFVAILNKIIYDNLQRINSDKNLTLILASYQNGVFNICGQHEELLLLRKGATEIERIDTINLGFPLGLEEDISPFLNSHKIQLNIGDTIILYTDGIPEAEDCSNNFYGIEKLCELALNNINQPVADIHANILADLYQHIGSQQIYDDITLMVIRREF